MCGSGNTTIDKVREKSKRLYALINPYLSVHHRVSGYSGDVGP